VQHETGIPDVEKITTELEPLMTSDSSSSLTAMRARLNGVILGKEDRIELVLACLLAGGHLLLDDLPGLGKTTLAKAIAACFGASFSRIQCTPDLLPTDITGFNLYNQKTREFEFHPGPVFSDILLADEINRTTPRTQSALFEAMAERQVTIDGQTRPLSPAFFVIATQNPIDSHGAYPLPEAQLDRFAMKLEIGYPGKDAQIAILKQQRNPIGSSTAATQIFTITALAELQRQVSACRINEELQEYLVNLCEMSREHESVLLGVSPRGMLIWQQVAKAWATLANRDFVIPDDIQAVAGPVLGVRLVTRGQSVAQVIESIMNGVQVPDYR
jgi:MoxR-like ATPase